MQEITLKVYSPKEKLPNSTENKDYLFCTTAGTILTGLFYIVDGTGIFEVKNYPYDVYYPVKGVLWWCENIFHCLQEN